MIHSLTAPAGASNLRCDLAVSLFKIDHVQRPTPAPILCGPCGLPAGPTARPSSARSRVQPNRGLPLRGPGCPGIPWHLFGSVLTSASAPFIPKGATSSIQKGPGTIETGQYRRSGTSPFRAKGTRRRFKKEPLEQSCWVLSCNVRFCNPAEGGKDVESRYCRSFHAFSGWQRRRPSELS